MATTVQTFLQSHHGPYLNAFFGGGPEGETAHGIPLGQLTARVTGPPGADETFYVDNLGSSQVAIRSFNGFFVAAEQGGGGPLNANRAYETPGPWEIFTYRVIDDAAGAVAFQTHGGYYITAELDGTVQATRPATDEGPGPWEIWIVDAPWWHEEAPPTGPGGTGNREAKGEVRLEHRVCRDETGPYLALGASFFWASRAWKDHRDRYDANMTWLAANGFTFYRSFATVGGWPAPDGWEYAGAFLPWALEVLPQVLDDAFTRYRLRCSLTLFDGECQTPTDGEQDAYVNQVCDLLLPRMHTIQDVQITNEYGPTMWDYPQGVARMRRHAETVRRRLGPHVPIALSSRSTAMMDGSAEEVYAECHKLFDGLLPDIVTVSCNHDSREIHKICGPWRPVRQGWERVVSDPVTGAQLEPDASIDDEPIGPCSSVAAEEDPSRIVQKAIVDWIAGRHQYTYHTDAGIWSDLLHPAHHDGMKSQYELIEHHPASNAVALAWGALVPKLPPDLTQWQRTRHGFGDHPFGRSFEQGTGPHGETGFTQIWPDGLTNYGVVRAYGALSGLDFVVALTGVKDRIDLKWTDKMRFDVYRCADGGLHHSIEDSIGNNSLVIHQSSDTDLVVIGRYL